MSHGDIYASPFGVIYSAYMERPRLSRMIGRLVWGGDSAPYYERMSAIAEVPEGGTVVDCPCGAGPALRALRPDAGLRYIAVDVSPAMLERARRRAGRRGLEDVEFVEADATKLPLPSASADLFLSLWGLHCFEDPAAALAEAARVLAPGGRLVGASFLRGSETWRQRALIRPGAGAFGQVPTQAEIEAWLAANHLSASAMERFGSMLYFDARRD